MSPKVITDLKKGPAFSPAVVSSYTKMQMELVCKQKNSANIVDI